MNPEPDIRHALRCRWNTLKARASECAIPLHWQSFDDFLGWARPRFVPGHCLDRIDRGLGFTPDNCRFVPRGDLTRRNLDLLSARARQDVARRIRESVPGESPRVGRPATPVRCVELGTTFPSIAAAARTVGLTNGAIWAAVQGRCRAAGFTWEYVQ